MQKKNLDLDITIINFSNRIIMKFCPKNKEIKWRMATNYKGKFYPSPGVQSRSGSDYKENGFRILPQKKTKSNLSKTPNPDMINF